MLQPIRTSAIWLYPFRADYNGTQFWSGTANHCDIPGCVAAQVVVTRGLTVTVQDTGGLPKSGVHVYAFSGSIYSGFNATTDESGQASFTLPEGEYRFRADYNGTQFWSGAANHCTVPGCSVATVIVTPSTLVTVQDTDGVAKPGLKVYVFNSTTYTGFNATTNAAGQVTFTLPQGSYRFRADYNGTQFWSGTANDCTIPGCDGAVVEVTKPLTVSVQNTDGAPMAGLNVYAFALTGTGNGTTYTGYNKTTDANGGAVFTLPQGSYRFRADFNGTQFWSSPADDCTLPGCVSEGVTVTKPVAVHIQDAGGTSQSGVKVYAFALTGTGNGTTYSGYNKTTDASGQAVFTLPQGSYRFRAVLETYTKRGLFKRPRFLWARRGSNPRPHQCE